VGKDVEAAGRVIGQVGQFGIGHIEDVDLNITGRGTSAPDTPLASAPLASSKVS
jgi:hypothetical protein